MRFFHPTFFLLIFLASISDGASDVESIIEGVKYNDSLIKSGQGNFIVHEKYMEKGKEIYNDTGDKIFRDKTYHIFYAFNGKKVRCDLGKGDKPLKHIYDGEKTIQLSYQREIRGNGKVDEYWFGLIYRNPRIIRIYFDPLYWGVKHDGKRAGQRLAERSPRWVGQELINKEMCEVIEIDAPSIKFAGKYKFWVAPEKGYRLLKIDISMPGESRRIVHHSDYKKLSGDIWFPWNSYHVNYFLDKEGNETALSKWSMDMTDYAVNIDLDEKLFRFDTSKVRKVFDLRIDRLLTQQEIDTLFD